MKSDGYNSLFYYIESKNSIKLSNIIFEGESTKFSTSKIIFSSYGILSSILSVDGFLYQSNISGKLHKYYIGSNFSDYFVSWRTGEIGLKTMQSAGSFYGDVNVEGLKAKGYSEVTI